jgi:hypothetical protein
VLKRGYIALYDDGHVEVGQDFWSMDAGVYVTDDVDIEILTDEESTQ